MRLRVKFRKFGPIRFIGHLDVMRFFQKAIRRAGIDVAYSKGFSPHQIMAFAAPLGVGLLSNGEYMDIEVGSIVSCQDTLERLNRAGTPGIEVTSVKVLPDTAGNAMASVAAAAYTVRFREGREPRTEIGSVLQAFWPGSRYSSRRKRKRAPGVGPEAGHLSPDLRRRRFPHAAGRFQRRQYQAGADGGSDFGRPGEALQENALTIVREDVYTDIGAPAEGTQERKLVPLDDIGYLI